MTSPSFGQFNWLGLWRQVSEQQLGNVKPQETPGVRPHSCRCAGGLEVAFVVGGEGVGVGR